MDTKFLTGYLKGQNSYLTTQIILNCPEGNIQLSHLKVETA